MPLVESEPMREDEADDEDEVRLDRPEASAAAAAGECIRRELQH